VAKEIESGEVLLNLTEGFKRFHREGGREVVQLQVRRNDCS